MHGVLEFHARAQWHVFEVRYVREHDGVQLREVRVSSSESSMEDISNV